MLLTVGTTEAVEAIAEAQENLQEVAKNPGILRTYFQNPVSYTHLTLPTIDNV